ncbi:DNA mismatch repair protein MutS [Puia sp.]|jgi:DNA mismatch repair protein MutS|uniref:DNA mismatch repair protein MutS n=1 Tax=Puia sp. TaxID=2045100 RepID=UPI002F4025E0
MAKNSADTPLMQQHRAIKQRYPDAILLFRVGDFYETFGEDAIVASKVLGITLTKRNNGAASSSELAGFPHHSLDTYLHKLVKAGHRVAVCDQLEDPKSVKGIVKRGVTELVTPGIATHDKLLESNTNNYLAGISFPENWPSSDAPIGLSFLDISTGEFVLAEGNTEYADKLLQTFHPSEVIFPRSFQKHFKEVFGSRFFTYTMESWLFDTSFATGILLKHFQTHSLKGYGVEEMNAGIIAAGALIHYLKETEHPNLQHLSTIRHLDRDDFLWMDKFTIRNLELLGPAGGEQGQSLLKVLDNTVSPMGARLLKRWLQMPLKDAPRIHERLDTVEFFIKNPDLRSALTQHIHQCGDIERLVGKIPIRRIGPREVLQLARGLDHITQIKDLAEGLPEGWFPNSARQLDPRPEVSRRILATIADNPPAVATKGDTIRAGVNEELDRLRDIATNGKEYLIKLQQKEAERSGITSLKIGFNNVFGYYLEVTNTHKDRVPPEWMRKQTLANAERYITPELKEYEETITGAEEKILTIESDLYEQLLTFLQTSIAPMQANGQRLAEFDCLLCFAANALQYNYKKPVLHEGREMDLKASRHPVIERRLPAGEAYIANDVLLDPATQQIIILTGPNMSGKSALLRQTALITLMAHMGSFVPCDAAHIPLTDKIFTRVGASDNLSGGESTFMVEMNETASIINNISPKSLIILDEIGRGTSTYDGISIAWSIAEYLHNTEETPKTLFATHYHELNELELKMPRIRNYHITNKEVGNKVVFLRKLAPGGSTHSFGIHVARMAGMPQSLLQRAEEVLRQLEDKPVGAPIEESLKKVSMPKLQLSIFDTHTETFHRIRKLLEDTDINRLTPVEALLKLQEIKSTLH